MAERRRGLFSWFVEPYRQVKLGLMFMLLNIFFAILFTLVVGYYFLDVYEAIAAYFKLSGDQGVQVLSKLQFPIYVGLFLIVMFVLSTLLVSVRYTYAIYGPLVSINRFLDDLLDSKPFFPIEVRESDQLKSLTMKLNKLGERVNPGYRQAPMVAIHSFIDELLAGGSPDPLTLRDCDHYEGLVEKLNQVRAVLLEK